jgi:Mor family transcriptional regulator
MNEEVREWLLNRDASIFEEHLNGVSNVEIALTFNLSPQRVCQIISGKRSYRSASKKHCFKRQKR